MAETPRASVTMIDPPVGEVARRYVAAHAATRARLVGRSVDTYDAGIWMTIPCKTNECRNGPFDQTNTVGATA